LAYFLNLKMKDELKGQLTFTRHIPKDRTHHSQHCENLKSNIALILLWVFLRHVPVGRVWACIRRPSVITYTDFL
jgi:hypothetical protein